LLPLVTAALLALFARSIDWRDAWRATVHADPMLLTIAMVANLASLTLKGVRWWLFLDAIGIRGVSVAIRATMAGAALNNLLVANGGDVARVAAMARRASVSSASVLATAAIDRLCDLVTYAALFVVAAWAITVPPEVARWRGVGLVALGLVAIAVAMVVVRGKSTTPGESGQTAERAPLLVRARAYARRIVTTSAALVTPTRLAIAVALSFAAWAGQWATFHYAAHAAGVTPTPGISLLALIVVNASFLVRLTPGNVGVFQLLYALAATAVGLDKDAAVAAAFLIQLIQYIPVTVVGLLLAPSLARVPRRMAAENPSAFDRDRMEMSAKRGT
jgi:uncharacterized protein (TIRG00374 family)